MMTESRLSADSLRELYASQSKEEAPKPKPSFRRETHEGGTRFAANMYAGTCVHCGTTVEAGAGLRRKNHDTGRWEVFHKGGCDSQPETPVKREQAPRSHPVTPSIAKVEDENALVEGKYTVVFENGEYATIRIRRQYDDSPFMPGRLIFAYLSGPDNGADFTQFGNVEENGAVRIWAKHRGNHRLREAVKVLLGDPVAALKAYGLRSRHCGLCGRELTTPESIEAGIGPVCAGKL